MKELCLVLFIVILMIELSFQNIFKYFVVRKIINANVKVKAKVIDKKKDMKIKVGITRVVNKFTLINKTHYRYQLKLQYEYNGEIKEEIVKYKVPPTKEAKEDFDKLEELTVYLRPPKFDKVYIDFNLLESEMYKLNKETSKIDFAPGEKHIDNGDPSKDMTVTFYHKKYKQDER